MSLYIAGPDRESNRTCKPRERKAAGNVSPCERPGCTNPASRYVREGRRYCSGDCLRVANAGGGK